MNDENKKYYYSYTSIIDLTKSVYTHTTVRYTLPYTIAEHIN